MSEGAVKQAALDLRREFGSVIRDEIRRTVADESQVDEEVRYLLALLRGEPAKAAATTHSTLNDGTP